MLKYFILKFYFKKLKIFDEVNYDYDERLTINDEIIQTYHKPNRICSISHNSTYLSNTLSEITRNSRTVSMNSVAPESVISKKIITEKKNNKK